MSKAPLRLDGCCCCCCRCSACTTTLHDGCCLHALQIVTHPFHSPFNPMLCLLQGLSDAWRRGHRHVQDLFNKKYLMSKKSASRALRQETRVGRSEVYAVLKCEDQERRTGPAMGLKHPDWKEEVSFRNISASSDIQASLCFVLPCKLHLELLSMGYHVMQQFCSPLSKRKGPQGDADSTLRQKTGSSTLSFAALHC